MKMRYVLAGAVSVVLLIIGYFALMSGSVPYENVARAEQLGKTAQIVGTWVKEKGSSYDEHANIFSFTLMDEQGKEIPVKLTGAKPNNFEIAVSVVVKGRVENGVLIASNVLTKCPSKYESGPEQK